jgi:hypothetical protein
MGLERLRIRTRLIRARKPEPPSESVVFSHAGGAWRSLQELQEWTRRQYPDSCTLCENGVSFVEELGRGARRHYEITVA